MVIAIWRANLMARQVTLLQIILAIAASVVTLVLLIPMDMGWVSQIYALGAIAILQVVFLLNLAIRNRWLSWEFDRAILKRSLIYAVPLIPNVAAGWIAGFSDRQAVSRPRFHFSPGSIRPD